MTSRGGRSGYGTTPRVSQPQHSEDCCQCHPICFSHSNFEAAGVTHITPVLAASQDMVMPMAHVLYPQQQVLTTKRMTQTYKGNNRIHSLNKQGNRFKSKYRNPAAIVKTLIVATLSIITTRLVLLASIIVDHSNSEKLVNHLLRQRINPRLQHLQRIFVGLLVLAIALMSLVVSALVATWATRMLVVFLLALPHHHEEESGDEVDSKEATDDG